jgi:hypothetical protein
MLNFINSLSEDLTERRDLNSVLEDLNEDFSDLNDGDYISQLDPDADLDLDTLNFNPNSSEDERKDEDEPVSNRRPIN